MTSQALHNVLNNLKAFVDPDQFKTRRWANLDEAHFLYNLIRFTGARTVIECGTANGFSTSWMAMALRDNGGGIIHTWDPINRPKVWNLPLLKGLSEQIEFHNTEFGTADVTRCVEFNGSKTLWFIDGDHSRRSFQQDISVFDDLAELADVLVLHDIDGYRWIARYFERIGQEHQSIRVPTRHGIGAVIFQ